MYRVTQASSGYYFVQQYNGYNWKKVGKFFHTFAGARNFGNSLKYGCHYPPAFAPRVVQYL